MVDVVETGTKTILTKDTTINVINSTSPTNNVTIVELENSIELFSNIVTGIDTVIDVVTSEKGDKGDAGPTGSTGPTGDTGPQGDIGLQGTQGIQGAPGEDGDNIEVPYSKRVDFITDDLLYRGEANPGTAESVDEWRVRKIIIGADNDVTELWASGNANFDKKWEDHLILSYS